MNKQQVIELAQRALDAAQAMPDEKPLKGRIYDLDYRGGCWFVWGDGTVTKSQITVCNNDGALQGRAFYDQESAELFSRVEQVRFRLLSACKAECEKAGWEPDWNDCMQEKYFLLWDFQNETLDFGGGVFHYNDFVIQPNDDHLKSIKSQFTSAELKLAITGME